MRCKACDVEIEGRPRSVTDECGHTHILVDDLCGHCIMLSKTQVFSQDLLRDIYKGTEYEDFKFIR